MGDWAAPWWTVRMMQLSRIHNNHRSTSVVPLRRFHEFSGDLTLAPKAVVGATAIPVTIGRNFPGTPSFDRDSDAAVGTRHFAELTNRSFRVYDKLTGALLYQTGDLFATKMGLFGCCDQRLRFDHSSNRWIAIEIANPYYPSSALLIGVSATDDPSGDWSGVSLTVDPAGKFWADYPLLGLDSAGVYITSLLIPVSDPNATTIRKLFSIPKADLFQVNPTAANASRLLVDLTPVQPQTDYLGGSSDGAILKHYDYQKVANGDYTSFGGKRTVIGADDANATLSNEVVIEVPLGPNDVDVDRSQPGTKQILGDNDGAVGSVRVGRFLYLAEIIADMDGDLGASSWSQRDVTSNTSVQGGTIAVAGHALLDPGIGVNEKGEVVIAYVRSGPNEFGSAYASVGHPQTDGTLVFDPPLLLKAGTDIYDENGPEYSDGIARFSDFSSSVTVDPLDHGRFWVSNAYISGRNSASTYISELRVSPETPDPTPSPRLLLQNISTRGQVEGGDNVLIGGFIITGGAAGTSKQVAVRALGPSLTGSGVFGALADPTLELHKTDPTGHDVIVATNENWKTNSAADQQTITGAGLDKFGAPPAEISDLESIIIADLPTRDLDVPYTGLYTAIVRGAGTLAGVALVEVYDLDDSTTTFTSLGNISTRGLVGTGDDVLIGGIIVGPSPHSGEVVLRAIGPSLPLSGTLQDPNLDLKNANGATVFSNDNWLENDPADVTQLQNLGLTPANSAESAMVTTLAAGEYTAIVTGVNDTTGIALVEAYNLNN
jgi:hypothetical protein